MDRSVIHQTLYKEQHPPITLEIVQLGSLSDTVVNNFLATATSNVGVAASYGAKYVLEAIAFATSSNVLLVNMGKQAVQKKGGKKLLCDTILCHPSYQKYAFNMDRIASALHLDLGVPIQGAYDIQHQRRGLPRGQISTICIVLNGDAEDRVYRDNVWRVFQNDKPTDSPKQRLALRAWASCKAASLPTTKTVPAIDTKSPDLLTIRFLAKSLRDADRLDSLKPTSVKNDIGSEVSQKNGLVDLKCTRYKTRLRVSGNQKIEFDTLKGTVVGRAVKVEGKSARIYMSQKVGEGSIRSVITIGKEEPTSAESRRSGIILNAFQGSEHLLTSPFVRKIFFPTFPANQLVWPAPLPGSVPPVDFPYRSLNSSQRKAVEFCLCRREKRRIGLIVGPPGTGKTTVIAACVTSIINGTMDGTVWVVAQSNVAVKNVAEKLAESGFFSFKLLVSNEFHFDWHEHLYHRIEENVIQSSVFGSIVENDRLLGGARVILCTTSMLSNSKMHSGGFPHLVPVQTVIVDEASQIEVGDYLPLLSQFKSSLQKLVLIGDDKQLAPYGQEDIGNLRSVFEIPHLRNNALFLDTQYRMPTAVGDFISQHVYKGKLNTVHDITSSLCCRFVDVVGGVETQPKGGNSWINIAEVNAIVHVAKRYRKEGKPFRIITAYDAQRNLLERALQSDGLQWEDTCFNVDSFQGNEEDHIILSVVRTNKPGFLKNARRMNVMLTRCKRSMMIFSSKNFLRKEGIKPTLVGMLAAEWTDRSARSWITMKQILNGTW